MIMNINKMYKKKMQMKVKYERNRANTNKYK